MSKKKNQFWVGKFENENVFNNFFNEVYSNNDKEPISRFAESQNEKWIDHDFLEIGFEESEKTIKEKFGDYSYSDKWMNIFESKLAMKNIEDINAIIMVSYDKEESQINSPKSYKEEKFQIKYLGEIEYKI